MALTQMQLIQSLGEAMNWFERELAWGVPPTELRHLCGRIGELYAALITNGRMATEVNQRGYDVVSAANERISVKTTAMSGSGGHIAFNAKTLEWVDRIMVFRVNTEEMQIEKLLDASISEAIVLMSPEVEGKRTLSLGRIEKKTALRSDIATVREAMFQEYRVRELENGSIEIEQNEVLVTPAKSALRELAVRLNVGLLNGNGNAFNTRQLGSQIINSIEALSEALAVPSIQ
ncbi:DUF6998 domain-containing protein [Stenotrophobium rhamnosiphilum]|uniref:DUF6998 domain-containing protein n=1 Tax=Stenotrophobium rhamnosiphilum TaxID=2029166 RepID=A0A2T5MBP2_9GAMM|nr:hypothetical protein [Stenotrophobium rhamnosiphilum]PTU29152.1 hypothetical protein CJD38_17540 [Stenotrophobium rhamnosiphilum]